MRQHLWSPWDTARVEPHRLGVVAGSESVTFGELVAGAELLAAGLHGLGVADGAVVSTDLPAGPRLFSLLLAGLRYGYGVFPVHGDDAAADGWALLARTGTALHVGVSAPETVVPCRNTTYDRLVALGARSAPRAPGSRAGYLVFASSGTTGPPTPVVRARPWRPYRGVAVRPRYAAGLAMGPHIMANPSFHLGTLGPALYALQAGSAVVVQPVWSADGLLDLIDGHRADSLFLSPDRLIDVVAHGRWARHRPLVVFHGGSACAQPVKRAAIALLGPVLHEYYGISQTVVTEISTEEWLRHPGSVGRALPGVGVEINAAAGSGGVGEIMVRPRGIDRTARPDTPLGTGDLGYLDDDGYLFVLGRTGPDAGDPLATLEHGVRNLPGVADVAVVGSRPATCVVEVMPDAETTLRRRIVQLVAATGRTDVAIELRPAGQSPRTASGKIRRFQP